MRNREDVEMQRTDYGDRLVSINIKRQSTLISDYTDSCSVNSIVKRG